MTDAAIDPAPASESPRRTERRASRRGLSPSQRRDAIALAEALWSPDAMSAPPADRLAYFADDLSDFIGCVGTRARLLFSACLAAITFVAPLAIGRFARLGSLSIGDRVAAIVALERTPASLALFAAKAMVSIVWWEHPGSARDIGWDQRCRRSR
jgi:hypothetical protein